MPTPSVSQNTQSYSGNWEATYDEIERELGIVRPQEAISAPVSTPETSFLSDVGTAVEDAALGMGSVVSTAVEGLLPGEFSPAAARILGGSFRAAGGLFTAATSGYRIVKTLKDEYEADSVNYPKTRKEVVVTAGSVTAGLGVGTLAGAATSVAAFVGAPALVVGGLAAAGVIGAGYAAYAARDYLSDLYDSL